MQEGFDTVIKLSAARAELVVEQMENGVIKRKTLTPETFGKCILGSRYDESVHTTGFLPEHCFCVTLSGEDRIYYLRCPTLRADISYYGTEYENFPLPRLVFAFKYAPESGKVLNARLAVVPDERLNADTVLYRYPFSNVHDSFGICLGNNALPVYKDPGRLHTLMALILRFPNNNDMFSPDNNKLELGYRDLLEHLKDKEPSYYYTDILIPSGKTLKDFMNGR